MGEEADADWEAGLIEAGIEDAEDWRRNRDRKTAPKLGRSWCPRCDRSMITVGQKCFTSRRRNVRKGTWEPSRALKELLPCPFCGEGKIFLNPPSEHHPRGSINCPACLVVMPGAVGGDAQEAELIASWNLREKSTKRRK